MKYGLKKDSADERDFLYKSAMTDEELPKDVNLTDKCPEIWNQENLNSCQSFAIDRIVSYLHNNNFDPSHLFVYYNVRKIEGTVDKNVGATLRDTCKAVADNGVADEKFWPYDVHKFMVKPSVESYIDGQPRREINYLRINTLEETKHALAKGHLPMVGVEVYESFESEECKTTGIIPPPIGKLLGGHAMVIVGYHDSIDDNGYFIIANSWGTDVGCHGYFLCTYKVFMKIFMDIWVVTSSIKK